MKMSFYANGAKNLNPLFAGGGLGSHPGATTTALFAVSDRP